MKPTCFYCGSLTTKTGKGDHMPVPKNAGGTRLVPCCVSCHMMKDSFCLDDWPEEWMRKVESDFPKFNRETRIFLAKAARLFAEARKDFEQ